MPDKCQSHDQCIERINDQLTDMRDDLHRGVNELKEMLHAGAVLHTKFEMRFESHDHEIKKLQNEIAEIKATPKGVDWRGNLVRMGFSLAEKAFLIICAAAVWAFFNGYMAR